MTTGKHTHTVPPSSDNNRERKRLIRLLLGVLLEAIVFVVAKSSVLT